MSLDKAKEIVLERIPVEIFLGHNALGLYVAISENAEALRNCRFAHTFGLIQRQSLAAFIISLCRLFEKSRYPNFGISTAISHMQEHVQEINAYVNNWSRLEEFISGVDSTYEAGSQADDVLRIPRRVLEYFADQHPQHPCRVGYKYDSVFEALKVLRDKRIAHPEDCDIDALSKTDIDGALSLLFYAQTFVNICGHGFFGFSKKAVANKDEFDPHRSRSWSEMYDIIKGLRYIIGNKT